jgi:hypothetical protein
MHPPLLQSFKRAARFFAVLILFSLPSVLAAGEPDCDFALRDIVQAREFRLAYYCAEQQLASDPDNIDAMLVLARAAQELGQMERADELAKAARTYPLTTGQRFAAFLISGMAQASQQNLTSAKILLYRASDFARLEPEHEIVRRVLAQINADSPWKFRLGGNILPSTNINSGSLHDTFELGGFEFVLNDDAKAQSGIGYTVSASATHQRRLSDRIVWENSASLSGTAYDGRGRNDAQYTLESGLRYTPKSEVSSLIYGYTVFDKRYIGEEIGGPAFNEYTPYYSQLTFGLEYHQQPDTNSAWKVFATYTDRISDVSPVLDALIATVGGSYTFALNDNVILAFSGFMQDTQSDSADAAAAANNLTAAMTWTLDTLPITLSGNLGVTHTDYKILLGIYSERRVDDAVTLELALTHDDIQFYGFNPTFGLRAVRNYSNYNRHDTETVEAFTRLSTSF